MNSQKPFPLFLFKCRLNQFGGFGIIAVIRGASFFKLFRLFALYIRPKRASHGDNRIKKFYRTVTALHKYKDDSFRFISFIIFPIRKTYPL